MAVFGAATWAITLGISLLCSQAAVPPDVRPVLTEGLVLWMAGAPCALAWRLQPERSRQPAVHRS